MTQYMIFHLVSKWQDVRNRTVNLEEHFRIDRNWNLREF